MRTLVFLLSAASAFAQSTPVFPARAATNSDLFVASNNYSTTLTAGITSTATSATVASGSGLTSPAVVTIDSEIAAVCQVSGNTLTFGRSACPNVDGRGIDATAAAAHVAGKAVQGRVTATLHNQLAAETVAIENSLVAAYVIDTPYANFSLACAAAASASKTLLLVTHWTNVGAGPFACDLWVMGGYLTIGTSTTAAFNGRITNHQARRLFDTQTNSGAVVTLSAKCCDTVYPQWWGGAWDGSTIDDAPVNAALAAAHDLLPVAFTQSFAAKNVINPNVANTHLKLVFAPGVVVNCKNNDGSTCWTLQGTGNPMYKIDGQMTLYGPDGNTTSGFTTTSGHGLVTSGGTPILAIDYLVAWGFHGTTCTASGEPSGCAGFVPRNVEDSRLGVLNLQFDSIGWKDEGHFNANEVAALVCSQDDTYGCYFLGAYSNHIGTVVAQSNTVRSFYASGFGSNAVDAYHEENPNTSDASVNSFEINASATFGSSTQNVFVAALMLGANGKAALSNTSSTNADNSFVGGGVSSGYQGITLDAGSSHQAFDRFVTKAQILSGYVKGETEVNEPGNFGNTYGHGALSQNFYMTGGVNAVPALAGFAGGSIASYSTNAAGRITVGGTTNNGAIGFQDPRTPASATPACSCTVEGSTTVGCSADGMTSPGNVLMKAVGGNWVAANTITYLCDFFQP